VKCGSARKVGDNFRRKYPGNTVPSTTSTREIINKARCAVSLLDNKPAEKQRVLAEEKVNEMGAR
jgi:hypothetical protein